MEALRGVEPAKLVKVVSQCNYYDVMLRRTNTDVIVATPGTCFCGEPRDDEWVLSRGLGVYIYYRMERVLAAAEIPFTILVKGECFKLKFDPPAF